MATVTAADVSYQAANESAKQQMDFQKMMSDTAHQREVADLKAAGLNPILSANQGAQVTAGAEGYVGAANAKKFDEAVAKYNLDMKELELRQKIDLLREETNAKILLKSLDSVNNAVAYSSGSSYKSGSSGYSGSSYGKGKSSGSDKKVNGEGKSLPGTIADKLLNNKDKGITGVIETAAGYLLGKYGDALSNTVAKKISGRITDKKIIGGSAKKGTGFGTKNNSYTISRGNGRNTSSNPIASARKNLNNLIRADKTNYSAVRRLY